MTDQEFLKEFQQKLLKRFPNGYQHWWSKFIFHFSDIGNIKSILDSGKLYSRQKAIDLGLMNHDNANDDVISNTSQKYKNYVRCYFGAKTPTQYQNEGIKPVNQIQNNAHCPVPVFLLFDFVKLLSIENILFSNGNIAATGVDIYSQVKELNKLEFECIYHRESLPDDSYRGHIMYCRHAEVLVPNELYIYQFLKFVCVRSEAEKETLLYGLDDQTKEKLRDKVKVFTQDGIFFNNRLFVNSIRCVKNEVIINFSNISSSKFHIQVVGKDIASGIEFNKSKNIKLPKSLKLELKKYIGDKGFYLCIEINNHTAYENILFNQIGDIV